VEQPWDARTLVTAGAGAGKTYTLVRRLDALIAREELTASEILVLSFSRAAVRELRERIERHATAAQRVRTQTFDSWASSLLAQAYPDADWSGTTFDDRIEAATKAIGAGAVEAGEYGAPAHILIDEVQDLVGVRREMVEELIDRLAGQTGFTLVGDGAQSVYGFQVKDLEARAHETNYFFDWVRASFPEDLVEVELTDNFRARTPQARAVLTYGPELQRMPTDRDAATTEGERIHRALRMVLAQAPEFGPFTDDFVQDSLRCFDGTTAVLCRTNGQALRVSELLGEAGIAHRLQRSVRDRSAPAWIARLLGATAAGTLSHERFTELLGELGDPAAGEPAQLWRSVRKVARGPRATLDLAALRRAVAEGQLPDELTAPTPSPLIVSSMHRAKGLEFDRVLVLDPGAQSAAGQEEYDPASEARLLYVAMTRPRDDLYRMTPPDTAVIRKDKRLDRWYVGGWKSWVRNGMEALGGDVCHDRPPGTRDSPAGEVLGAGRLQQYLIDAVHPGDSVELRMEHALPEGEHESPPFAILHAGHSIGEASAQFRAAVQHLLVGASSADVRQWPARITGLRIESVESVIGSTAATERAGLGIHGCWLAPRLTGLGRFDWRSVPLSELPAGADAS
jgi:hypothetical protein